MDALAVLSDSGFFTIPPSSISAQVCSIALRCSAYSALLYTARPPRQDVVRTPCLHAVFRDGPDRRIKIHLAPVERE